MLIEAFSEAKDPNAPEANEDRFVILPDRAFAVIDGVTDRLGTRYNGMLSGQYAANIVKRALEFELSRPGGPSTPKTVIATLAEAIAGAYRLHGILESARLDWNQRFSATLALALLGEDTIDIALVGDSGIRINESRILQVNKDLDVITSTLRAQAWPVICTRTTDPMMREKVSRRITWSARASRRKAFPTCSVRTTYRRSSWTQFLQMPRHCRTCRNGKSKLLFAAASSTLRELTRTTRAPSSATRHSTGSTFPPPSSVSSACAAKRFVDRTLHRRLFQAWRELRSGILGRGVQRSRKGRPRQGEAVSVSEGLDGIKLGRRSDLSGREVLSRTGRLLSPTSAAPHDGVSHVNMRADQLRWRTSAAATSREIGGSRPIRSPASRRRSPVAAQA